MNFELSNIYESDDELLIDLEQFLTSIGVGTYEGT